MTPESSLATALIVAGLFLILGAAALRKRAADRAKVCPADPYIADDLFGPEL